jgi:hypothetical protein
VLQTLDIRCGDIPITFAKLSDRLLGGTHVRNDVQGFELTLPPEDRTLSRGTCPDLRENSHFARWSLASADPHLRR